MIESLSIERFKSIKELSISCRKVNIFIGPPDTGKTNILEALYFLSRIGWGQPIDTSLRLRQELGFDALFYRQFFDEPIRIRFKLTQPRSEAPRELNVEVTAKPIPGRRLEIHTIQGVNQVSFGQPMGNHWLDWIRFYSYAGSEQWSYQTGDNRGQSVVVPPHGSNLLYIARHNGRVYDYLKTMVAALNWRLKFDQVQSVFRLSDVREDEIVEYNLDLLSDSLKRQFFYGAILLSSKDATIVLDEPDVFAFPPYPKALGEMIAADETNQFFLSTHNPYFLAGLIGKTPSTNLALFVCERDKEGSTRAKVLSDAAISKVVELGASVFFNLPDLGAS